MTAKMERNTLSYDFSKGLVALVTLIGLVAYMIWDNLRELWQAI